MKFGLKPNQPERYQAHMILDSVSPDAIRLATIHATMPRIILAEFNTHRSKTRNSRSTRAVPTTKLLQEVRDNPYRPLYWLKNKPGMQASEPMSFAEAERTERHWMRAARTAAGDAELLFADGLHKQWAGRVVEPYLFTDVLVSATDWANFMALRDHGDAQPEIELVAQRIRDCLDRSEPELIRPGAWHLPYITDEDWHACSDEVEKNASPDISDKDKRAMLIRYVQGVSAARCARVSYKPFDGNASIEAELKRFDALATSWPVHASPTEHQATPDTIDPFLINQGNEDGWEHPGEHRNFRGWRQHRAWIDGETVREMPARRHPLPAAAA